jgi:hypothetical protein
MDTGIVYKTMIGRKIYFNYMHKCEDSIKRKAGSWTTEQEAQKALDDHKEKCGS